MYDLIVYTEDTTLSIIPGKRQRIWMDDHTHSYKCTPLTIANEFGWDIILDYDIKVTWDGTNNPAGLIINTPEKTGRIKSHFGAGTITFNPGFRMKTEENIYIMVMPVPNQFDQSFLSLSAIIETDKLKYPWFISIKFLNKGTSIIKKGTKLARILPINVKKSIPTQLIIENNIPEEFIEEEKRFTEIRNTSMSNGERWTKDYVKKVKYKSIRMPE